MAPTAATAPASCTTAVPLTARSRCARFKTWATAGPAHRSVPRASARAPATRARPSWSGSSSRSTPGERLFVDLAHHAAGIARREHSFGNIARHHAARADHRARADPHARQNDRAAAHPHVLADLDRLAELLAPAQLGVE